MDWLTILFIMWPWLAVFLGLAGLYCLYRAFKIDREITIEPIIVDPIVASYRAARVGDCLKARKL